MRSLTRFGLAALGVALFLGTASVGFSAEAGGLSGPTPFPLPGGEGGIGLDDLQFSSSLHKVLVPGGKTGKLFLIDPQTKEITAIPGFTSAASVPGGKVRGTTSAVEGMGFLFASDREAKQVKIVDPNAKSIVGTANLEGGPDYVRFVAPNKEVWVTEPHAKEIEVFTLQAGDKPSLTHSTKIAFDDGPEALAVDAKRHRAYTHVGANTLAIDLATHAVVATWPHGCSGEAAGLDLDEARGWVLVGCGEGKAVVLDAEKGTEIGHASSGEGVDIMAYRPDKGHLYFPGAKSGTLSVFGVSDKGALSLLGTAPSAERAHCVTADDQGNVWVCDPKGGRLLLYRDAFPPSGR